MWVLFPALDLEIGAAAPWLILVANSFAIAIPSGPATVGVYEASVQAALIAYGISPSVGLSYAVVLHAVNFFPIILLGMVCSWWVGRHPAAPSGASGPTPERSGLNAPPAQVADAAAPGRTRP
jgi:uncharacterized membrane protein YbhN (UPF0104 family)